MIVFLADVIDIRADRSILLNANENVIVFTVAVAKQLYEEELGSRPKKNIIFQVIFKHYAGYILIGLPALTKDGKHSDAYTGGGGQQVSCSPPLELPKGAPGNLTPPLKIILNAKNAFLYLI